MIESNEKIIKDVLLSALMTYKFSTNDEIHTDRSKKIYFIYPMNKSINLKMEDESEFIITITRSK